MRPHTPFLSGRHIGSLCAGVLAATLLSPAPSAATEPPAVEATTPLPGLAALRWKLDESDWDYGAPIAEVMEAAPHHLDDLIRTSKRSGGGYNLHRSIEALVLKGDAASLQKARTILERLIDKHGGGDLNATVTTHGIEYNGITRRQESGGKVLEAEPPNRQRPTVLNFKDLAYEHAMLFLLTGDAKYAAEASRILLRFAEVAPQWPLYDRKNKPHAQDETAYLRHGTANGLWSVWNPLDLSMSLTLLRAYDIVRPTLTTGERRTVEENFFIHQKKLHDRFQAERLKAGYLYNNLEGYRMVPKVRFGLVLGRPDFIHETVSLWRRLISYSFTADGLWKELTPGYHSQVVARVTEMLPAVLHGYSDPAGYIDSDDGTRFDNLDLKRELAPVFGQMRDGFNVLAMPDNSYASINDAWPKSNNVPEEYHAILDKPGLLGIAGVAKLGAHRSVAFLQFDGTRGHDHLDALNLIWFTGGREAFSDTGYQALPGSDSTREWHTITASHNTVVVDGKSQFDNRERDTVTTPPEGQSAPPGTLSRFLPEAARVANQGRLLLWNAGGDKVHAMEAGQEKAYPGVTSLYRRTVVMIPEANGDSTLVDIFRVRGGSVHDFMLRGGLDAPYSITFNPSLKPREETVHSYIKVREAAEVRAPLLATVRYGDGYTVRSHLGGVFGSSNTRLEMMSGDAPAIRRLGRAPFSLLRHRFEKRGSNLESCFVWVHEAGREARLRAVHVDAADGRVKVTLERDGRTDWVFSAEDDAAPFEESGWAFEGHLAYASKEAGRTSGTVFNGGDLTLAGKTVAPGCHFASGRAVETTRRENGAATDTLLVKLDQASPSDDTPCPLVHIDFGPHARFSIPVTRVAREGEQLRLFLAHSPGFDVSDEKGATMSQYPGWAYSGPATILLETRPSTHETP